MYLLEGIRKIRVTAELDTGAADGSATAVTSEAIQEMGYSPVYVDNPQLIQRGGDSILAVIQEDPSFLGVDLNINMAALELALKVLMAGGTVAGTKWSAPADDTEMPYPFRLEAWVANYTESDSESTQDGFIKYEFAFCKRGKLGSGSSAQQAFTNDIFTAEARKNSSDPSSIEPAITQEKVSAIV